MVYRDDQRFEQTINPWSNAAATIGRKSDAAVRGGPHMQSLGKVSGDVRLRLGREVFFKRERAIKRLKAKQKKREILVKCRGIECVQKAMAMMFEAFHKADTGHQ